jgi:hypothetical protein
MPRWLHTAIFCCLAPVVCICHKTKTNKIDDVEHNKSLSKRYTNFRRDSEQYLQLSELRRNLENADDRNRNRCLFYLDEILGLLRDKNESNKAVIDQELSRQQRKDAARIIDRFLFIVYIGWNIVAFVVYLLVFPSMTVAL